VLAYESDDGSPIMSPKEAKTPHNANWFPVNLVIVVFYIVHLLIIGNLFLFKPLFHVNGQTFHLCSRCNDVIIHL